MALTPGLHRILTAGPKLLLPPLLAHAALLLVHPHPPRPLLAAVWLLTLPLYAYVSIACTRLLHARAARRMGAQLLPAIPGNLPGNIDLTWTTFFRKNLYILDGLAEPMESLGNTIAMNVMGDVRVFTAEPQNIKQLLATDFDNYEKGEEFNKFTGSVLGTGVFNSDGGMWQFHRKITRPYFAKERVTDFGIFDAKSRIALDKMQERLDSGNPIDFQDICSRFTLDSACEFLLGAPINSLEDPLPQPGQHAAPPSSASNRFARAFADAQHSISVRARLGPLWELCELLGDRTRADMAVVRAFIEPLVRAAMAQRAAAPEDTLLQHLLTVTDDMKLVVDETVNIMLAGRDTTAALLTFIVYCLALHPAVLARLRAEILSTVGAHRAPTPADVRDMKFLRAVVNETLRLFPSVPLNSRYTIRATTLVNAAGTRFYVPAHTRVTYSVLLMQRSPACWGPDAHLFDPDRWLDARVRTYLTPNPFIFLPFNAGPRICLGQQFAYHEASFFVVRLLQRVGAIALAPDAQPVPPPAAWRAEPAGPGTPRKRLERIVLRSHLTMYAAGGLWVRMGRAAEGEGAEGHGAAGL